MVRLVVMLMLSQVQQMSLLKIQQVQSNLPQSVPIDLRRVSVDLSFPLDQDVLLVQTPILMPAGAVYHGSWFEVINSPDCKRVYTIVDLNDHDNGQPVGYAATLHDQVSPGTVFDDGWRYYSNDQPFGRIKIVSNSFNLHGREHCHGGLWRVTVVFSAPSLFIERRNPWCGPYGCFPGLPR